jgi:hypothetical protein
MSMAEPGKTRVAGRRVTADGGTTVARFLAEATGHVPFFRRHVSTPGVDDGQDDDSDFIGKLSSVS